MVRPHCLAVSTQTWTSDWACMNLLGKWIKRVGYQWHCCYPLPSLNWSALLPAQVSSPFYPLPTPAADLLMLAIIESLLAYGHRHLQWQPSCTEQSFAFCNSYKGPLQYEFQQHKAPIGLGPGTFVLSIASQYLIWASFNQASHWKYDEYKNF